MSLKNRPYFPLYVKDFVTDEKLLRCSAETIGVYIWLLCYMHKSEKYGAFVIQNKDRISDDISDDFARVFSSFSPFSQGTIQGAFQQLLDEEILYIYRNWLCQKRMMKDGEVSAKRALSGKMGAKARYQTDENICYSKNLESAMAKPLAKPQQNAGNAIAVVNSTDKYYEDINNLGNVTTRTRDGELAQVMAHYADMIGSVPPPRVYAAVDGYLDHMEVDVIMNAVDIAAGENKRSWSYVEGILKSWKTSGVRNMADVAREDEEWRNKKNGNKSGTKPKSDSGGFKGCLDLNGNRIV